MDLSNAKISKLYIHYVGSKVNEEGLKISKRKVDIEEVPPSILQSFYATPFIKVFDTYNFAHPSSLKFNEIFNFAGAIFENPSSLQKISGDIAKHLYENSAHPKISSGELHVVYFKDCIVDEKTVDAVGIFKTETKIDFIKLNLDNNGYDIKVDQGINPAAGFDKGCLIFNLNKKSGFKLYLIDNQSRSLEAQYWKEKFLNVKPCADEYHQTQNYLHICKEFLSNKFPEEFETTKADQIDLLNRSIGYFKTNENFAEKEFIKEVFEDAEVVKSFKKFKNDYSQQNEIEVEEQFGVSAPAVKKQSRVFKSVLKLDRNFHIYIHGDKELIERGVDKDGRKFYKIYYDEEN